MSLEHRFACSLPNGMHARPASCLQAAASGFTARIVLINERTGVEANIKSVLALISADMQPGDPLLLRVSGPGEDAAFEEIVRFLRDEFVACDEALATPAERAGLPELPRSLQAAAPARVLRGTIQCRGLGEGVITRVEGLRLSAELCAKLDALTAVSGADEWARFNRAVATVRQVLEAEIRAATGLKKEVLRAHEAVLGDVSLAESIERRLEGNSTPLGRAIIGAVDEFSATLRRSSSVYLQERVLDLADIGGRLLREVYGDSAVMLGPILDRPSIIVAESLTPGQFLAMPRDHLRGLVLQAAGATSHTVILARSFGLPALVGVEGATGLPGGVEAILDANLGILLPDPNPATRRYYVLERRRIERAAARMGAFILKPGASHDGRLLPVLANVSSAEEVSEAIAQGAEGIGLFRTEMLFIDRAAPPTEKEQTDVYTEAVLAAPGLPVTLRTFDIGGDKPAPYLNLPAEANPFLGYRGARLYPRFTDLLKTQLRAMFRAAAHGRVRIMAPMIASPEEMRSFRAIVDEVAADFPRAQVPVGMMIEVPSAAFTMPEFALSADFFSIGTNDLLQYFFAVDRDNARVAPISSAFQPAFLRLLRNIVDGARNYRAARGKPVGLCGAWAENAEALPILLGLGLDSISLGAHRIPATKAELAALDFAACGEKLQELLNCPDQAAVESRLGELRGIAPPPLLAVDLIDSDSDGGTKHEVIKQLTDLLDAAGRLKDAAAVEEAIWRREETYSTGFGYGFAVPHCQSAHVDASSIALVRLRQPVEWGALDGQPVRVAILIALRAEDKGCEHLKVFAKLSRLVMNEEFRARLEQAADAPSIFSTLLNELNPPQTP